MAGEDGYLRVTIHHNGERLTRYVHILVCELFHGEKPSPRHQAAHRDGDKWNNAAENLRWKLPAENEAQKIQHGTYNHVGEQNPNSKLTTQAVADIRSAYAAGGVTQQILADRYGVSQKHVSALIRGRFWQLV